jgi:hypothetical protein
MGLYELLMDRRFDDEIAYLRLLNQAKAVGMFYSSFLIFFLLSLLFHQSDFAGNPWLQEGRAMRSLDLAVGEGGKSNSKISIPHPARSLNVRYQDHSTYDFLLI